MRSFDDHSKKQKYNTVTQKPDIGLTSSKTNANNLLKSSISNNLADKSETDSNFDNMQGLMTEKERLNQEQDKIKKNKFLKMVDRNNAIKSVRSLSRTIDDLINKEKEKISDHYNSKILEKSRISNFNDKSNQEIDIIQSHRQKTKDNDNDNFLA